MRRNRLVIIGLLSWLLMNLSWVGLSYLFSQQVRQHWTDLPLLERRSRQLSFLVSYYPIISLGIYRLPLVFPTYTLAQQKVKALHEGVKLIKLSRPLVSGFIKGTESTWSAWQEAWVQSVTTLQTIDELGLFTDTNTFSSFQSGLLPAWQAYESGLHNLMGFDKEKRYVVLMQNNMELRPTGGFLGSYAEVWVKNGALTNLSIQDIYVPDGQIKGYVKEPAPIREYLFAGNTPGWRLRDSNWKADFQEAAKDMRWFFEEGGVLPIDGMVGINLYPILDILTLVGPIPLPDYQMTVTADTFYRQAQYAAEHDFFPGSTQKRDFLGAVGEKLLAHVTAFPLEKSGLLLKPLLKNLETKQITVALADEQSQSLFTKLHWNGSIRTEAPDFLYVNEANLGINKTNCCIERNFSDTITLEKGKGAHHALTLTYINHNPPIPQPPISWGGGYKNYVRLYIPPDAQLESVSVDGQLLPLTAISLSRMDGYTEIGFLMLTQGGMTGTAVVTYLIPKPIEPETYALFLTKQPGIDQVPYRFTFLINGQETTREIFLTKDSIIR